MTTLLKLAVLGSGAVGKSALTIMYLNNHFIESYDPTIEDAYRKQVQIDSQAYLLDILDTAGQEEYSCMRDQYLRNGQGFILVYSITDRNSFTELETLHEQVLMAKDKDKVPMVLCGNKCDLEEYRQVLTQEGRDFANQYQIPFFETSARTRLNVDEAFAQLCREITKEFPNSGEEEKKKMKKKSKLVTLLGQKVADCKIV